MKGNPKFVIIAPFWGNPSHVGVYRVERFVRWLVEEGVKVVLVRAGLSDRTEAREWGLEITIRDPLKLHGEVNREGGRRRRQYMTVNRRPNPFRRLVASWLLIPEPAVVWAWRAAQHSTVLKSSRGATHVLASSPPEYAHVAASRLARTLRAGLVVDMRDGWLDEPLRPLLRSSKLHRWLEGRLEKRILRQARHVFVTSEVWNELLAVRLPSVSGKVSVLTNTCPTLCTRDEIEANGKSQDSLQKGKLLLVHFGKFTGSRSTQRPAKLLEPLMKGIQTCAFSGEILLLGDLMQEDLDEINCFKGAYERFGWSLVNQPRLPREEGLQLLKSADGFLLLSASHAAIPSKLFEYLIMGKPILACTRTRSAVWRIGEGLEQVFLVNGCCDGDIATVGDFLNACTICGPKYDVPKEFSEETTSGIFFKKLRIGQ